MKATFKHVVICSSAAFYEHVNQIAAELEKQGITAIVPKTARRMRKSGNYDVASAKTWYKNADDFKKKAKLMKGHFDEVADPAVEAILVVNDAKHGIEGYIGPNVLMEMGLAFYFGKQIYVLNNVDKDMPVYEEVMGMGSILLGGEIKNL